MYGLMDFIHTIHTPYYCYYINYLFNIMLESIKQILYNLSIGPSL